MDADHERLLLDEIRSLRTELRAMHVKLRIMLWLMLTPLLMLLAQLTGLSGWIVLISLIALFAFDQLILKSHNGTATTIS